MKKKILSVMLYNEIFKQNFFTVLFFNFIFTNNLYRISIKFTYDGNNRDFYSKYFYFLLSLFFLSILSFFISNKIKQYLIISSVSVIFSLYMFEAYLTYEFDIESKRKKAYFQKNKKKFDDRSIYEVYHVLKKKEDRASVAVHPANIANMNFSIKPLSGMSKAKTILCNENGYYANFLSDRFGFNNPDKEWDAKEISYLLVGDSFVIGECVNRPHDISSVLRNLSNKSVINLGYAGNGPLIEYASLREYLGKNMTKVIWIFYEGNDFIDLNYELNIDEFKSYLNNTDFSQNLKNNQNKIDNLVVEVIKKQETK